MANMTEAGLCRKYLNRKELSDQKLVVLVKFFCSPTLSEKILDGAQKSKPIQLEQEPLKE